MNFSKPSTLNALMGASALALTLAGCSGLDNGPGGQKQRPAAQSSQGALPSTLVRSALLNSKPEQTQRATTTPSRLPPAMQTGAGEVVAPPNPLANDSGDSAGDETWSFDESAGIDVDGDGEVEVGDALFDEESNTLFVWWSDTDDLYGDGTEVLYDAVVWFSETEVGLILQTSDVALACIENDEVSFCMLCNASGTCELLSDEGADSGYDDFDDGL